MLRQLRRLLADDAGGAEVADAVEIRCTQRNLESAGIAGFSDVTRIQGNGDPDHTEIALRPLQLRGDIVGVVVEYVSQAAVRGEGPFTAITGEVFAGEVTD